jgi:DNA-binding MarR family transcriptional regulator
MHDSDQLIAAIPSTCILHRTRMAARALSRHYQRFFRGLELTGSQFEILATLAAKPDQSIAALGREARMDATTVVRAVQQLQRRGLVRAEGGQGRQAKRSTLTPEGRKLLRRAVPRWKAAHDAVVQALGGPAPARSALGVIKNLETAAGALLAPAHPVGAGRPRAQKKAGKDTQKPDGRPSRLADAARPASRPRGTRLR